MAQQLLCWGTSLVDVFAVNEVNIAGAAQITAYGDLKISAGMDPDNVFVRDVYDISSRYDAFAGSAIPISDLHAQAYLIQENNVTIGVGAHLKTARQALLRTAEFSINKMDAAAKATSWASEAADGILSLTGGTVALYPNAEVLQESHGTVTNNGKVETGITRFQYLNITGVDVNGNILYDASEGVSIEQKSKIAQSNLGVSLTLAQQQLITYGDSDPELKKYYTEQINI